ncbi:hypothetical protein B0H13DRAFT_1927244 [Mycena leptocephala]|nr:hypothetical protein B0H13DRAFT_1927244 [Mycena leptocephala]
MSNVVHASQDFIEEVVFGGMFRNSRKNPRYSSIVLSAKDIAENNQDETHTTVRRAARASSCRGLKISRGLGPRRDGLLEDRVLEVALVLGVLKSINTARQEVPNDQVEGSKQQTEGGKERTVNNNDEVVEQQILCWPHKKQVPGMDGTWGSDDRTSR